MRERARSAGSSPRYNHDRPASAPRERFAHSPPRRAVVARSVWCDSTRRHCLVVSQDTALWCLLTRPPLPRAPRSVSPRRGRAAAWRLRAPPCCPLPWALSALSLLSRHNESARCSLPFLTPRCVEVERGREETAPSPRAHQLRTSHPQQRVPWALPARAEHTGGSAAARAPSTRSLSSALQLGSAPSFAQLRVIHRAAVTHDGRRSARRARDALARARRRRHRDHAPTPASPGGGDGATLTPASEASTNCDAGPPHHRQHTTRRRARERGRAEAAPNPRARGRRRRATICVVDMRQRRDRVWRR